MLNIGLLGAGYIASYHIKGLARVPNVKISAVCDVNLQRARQLAKNLPGAKSYSSLESMLGNEKLDAVHVLTPPDFHAIAAEKIIGQGIHVFLEKPMAVSENECKALNKNAVERKIHIGVNHNFLFYPAYQRFKRALAEKRMGALDHITLTWQKNMDQLKSGPYGIWMLRGPKNLWLETAPHLCSILLDLAGEPEGLHVEAGNPWQLPSGGWVYRHWLVTGKAGNASFEIRVSFTQGFEERSIEVRGQAGAARVDFERDTFLLKRHTRFSQPFDLFYMNEQENQSLLRQGRRFIRQYILSKFKWRPFGDPYAASIADSIFAFYRNLNGHEDGRQSGVFGERVTALCEKIANSAPQAYMKAAEQGNIREASADILILGGTGFIGQALVRELLSKGKKVRVLARDPGRLAALSSKGGLDIVRGDILDDESLERALKGVKQVYHLARAHVNAWKDYLQYDVEATRKVGIKSIAAGVERVVYTGTIDSYYAGQAGERIDESTPLDPQLEKRNYYAQAKAEGEKILLSLNKEKGLPVVIVRPGIVLGMGGSPFHWGVGMWHYETVCQFWGKGDNALPLVLVDDVVQGLILAMERQGIEGQSFNLVDKPCLSAREYVKSLENYLGAYIESFPTPLWKFFLMECFKWGVKILVRHPERRSPSWRDWSSKAQLAIYDCSKAEKQLGWKPSSSRDTILEEGVRKPAIYWWS